MKRLSIMLTAILLAVLFALQASVQVVGAAESSSEYISEVKVFMAKEESDAKSALQSEGYTLLDCNLNQGAEGGVGSKGKKATYLGYKTTTKSAEAITDLAVMNMKGGYSTEDYEALMDQYINGEVMPFVDNFVSAIREYRTNYTSDNEANQNRAQYAHDVMNKFTDDDCGGAGLGDLLLNKTKYEMGDDAYNALSDSEKNNHADLVTIIAQSNGKAELLLENMITRASDTNDDTWIDRFSETTYDDLVDMTGKTPTDAKQDLAKKYDDDAQTILDELWDDFKEALDGIDDTVEEVNNYDSSSYEEAKEALESLSENATDEEKESALEAYYEAKLEMMEILFDYQIIAIHGVLETIDYEDGTLLDFFTQSSEDIEDDITVLYPMVASLTDGQRAGLEFVSLRELAAMAVTPSERYEEVGTDDIETESIYDGVDREIYERGGVALTNDARRADADALNEKTSNDSKLSGWTIASYVVTGVSLVALVGSASVWTYTAKSTAVQELKETVIDYVDDVVDSGWFDNPLANEYVTQEAVLDKMVAQGNTDAIAYNTVNSTSTYAKYLTIGCSIVTVAMSIVSIYLTFKDLYDYYKVDLTPQPRYIVEESDITAYNKKGEKIVVKNQSAYYKIVPTNRDESDSNYENLGTGNDLNGDVGQQWLTLYSVKMEGKDPILASSLKAVVDSTDIPAGYEVGVHMFGEDTAYNLNNTNYVWNQDADSIYVYYKTDDSEASTAGSSFTMGHLALVGGIGLIVGAGLTAIIMTVVRKKKEKKAA